MPTEPNANPFTLADSDPRFPDVAKRRLFDSLQNGYDSAKNSAAIGIGEAIGRAAKSFELDHLRAVVAKRYATGWLRKILGWITGLQDNRPIMDELAVMREQGAGRFTQLEAAATTRLDNLAGKIERLEAAIAAEQERDQLKAVAEQLNRKLMEATAEADHWRQLSTGDRAAMNAHLEQIRVERETGDAEHRAEVAALQSRIAAIAESGAILNLTNAFRLCAAGGSGPEFDQAIADLEQQHADLTGWRAAPAA